MVRTLTGIGFALALVGTAHAQDQQVAVKIDGKSHRALQAEIYRAAEQVCAAGPAATSLAQADTACFEATYADALHKLRATPGIVQTAYRSEASSAGLH